MERICWLCGKRIKKNYIVGWVDSDITSEKANLIYLHSYCSDNRYINSK